MNIKTSLAIAFAAAAAASPALADPAGPWSGPYLGVSGGYAWGSQGQHDSVLYLPSGGSSGTTTITVTSCGDCEADGHYSLGGGLIGGTVGYNWQQDRFVYGLESDGSWADISGNGVCGAGVDPHACGGSIEALGTVRGRLGIDAGPLFGQLGPVLFYVTGGLAVGDLHAWDGLYGGSGTSLRAGWTVGAGAEVMLTPNWSVKLEYLHVDLGDHNVFSAIPNYPEYVATTANIVRAGINYHFGFVPPPAPPLVSKY